MSSLATFGPYKILEALSSTPQAVSFVATPTTGPAEGYLLSLRFIAPKILAEPKIRERFVEELRTVSRLNHVNVLQTFDFGQWEDNFYLVLEMVHGRSLAVVLEHAARQQAALAPELAAFITAEICAGLSYAHTRRDPRGGSLDIVHGDLRPREVLVAATGELKVANFGLSRTFFRELSAEDKQSDDRCDYLAPEVLRGMEPTPQSDVFSVGAMAYRMVTGRMIRGAATPDNVSRLERPIEAARVLDPSVPEPLAEAIMRALSLEPERRHETTAEFRSEILGWLRKHSPGFGRHRLKAWLEDLLGAELTPASSQSQSKTLPRKDFAVSDPRSLLSPSSQTGEDDRSEILEHLIFSSQGIQKRPGSAPPVPMRSAGSKAAPPAARVRPKPPRERPLPSAAAKPPIPTALRSKPPPPLASGPKVAPPAKPPIPAAPPSAKPPTPEPRPSRVLQDSQDGQILVSRMPGATTASSAADAPAEKLELNLPSLSDVAAQAPAAQPEPPTAQAPTPAPAAPVQAAPAPTAPAPAPAPAPPQHQDYDYSTAVYGADDEDDSIPNDGLRPPRRNVGGLIFLFIAIVISGVALADLIGGVQIFSHLLQPPAPTETSIFVRSRPPNVELILNGEPTGLKAPASLGDLPIGEPITITAELAGYELEEPVNVTLTREGPTSALLILMPMQHTLRLDSEPAGATVFYNGEELGSTPTRLGPLRVDAREGVEVVLIQEGMFDERVNLRWEPGETQSTHRITLRPDPNWEPSEEEGE